LTFLASTELAQSLLDEADSLFAMSCLHHYSSESLAFFAIRPKVTETKQIAMMFGTLRDQEIPPIRSSVATNANKAASKLTKIAGITISSRYKVPYFAF